MLDKLIKLKGTLKVVIIATIVKHRQKRIGILWDSVKPIRKLKKRLDVFLVQKYFNLNSSHI